jgi:hypothetical protein
MIIGPQPVDLLKYVIQNGGVMRLVILFCSNLNIWELLSKSHFLCIMLGTISKLIDEKKMQFAYCADL